MYYGTKVDNLDLIQKGITHPFERNERYISISISGYSGILPLSVHDMN